MENGKKRMSLYIHEVIGEKITQEAWSKGFTIGEFFEYLFNIYQKAKKEGGEDQIVKELVRSELLKQLEQL